MFATIANLGLDARQAEVLNRLWPQVQVAASI